MKYQAELKLFPFSLSVVQQYGSESDALNGLRFKSDPAKVEFSSKRLQAVDCD